MILAALLLLLHSALAAEPVEEAVVEFKLGSSADGQLVLTAVESGEKRIVPIRGGEGMARLPPASRWSVESGSQAWWTPPEIVLVPPAGAPTMVQKRVWKTGAVSGKIAVAGDRAEPPKTVRLMIERVPGVRPEDGLPENTTIECPVGAGGSFTCHVPAGRHDLAIRADRFIPVYRWDTAIQGGARLNLGVIPMRLGASVSGWVAADAATVRLKEARVQLTRLVAPGSDGRMRERLTRPAATASVHADGFFQLAQMPAGTYRLVVEHGAFASAVLYPVEVFEGAETAIRTHLLLRKPASLRLFVEPSTAPAGTSWQLSLSRIADYGSSPDGPPAFEGEALPDGTVIGGLSPGTFRITLSDAEGNDFLRHLTEVPSGESGETLRLKLTPVRGDVSSRSKPVQAELWFGGEHGGIRVRARSDENGEFETMLPHDGTWMVDVRSESHGISTSKEVEVHGGPEDPAHVSIDLASTAVTGRVIDEEGRPIAGADVSLVAEKQALSVRTEPDGTFEFRAVDPGSVQLVARAFVADTPRQSDLVTLDVTDAMTARPVDLRLLATRRISGRVVSQRGPVAGASMTIARPGGGAVTATTTDLEGAWSADLPAADRSAIVTVSPPGHALRAFEVPLGSQPVVLHVPEVGGTLVVKPKEREGYLIRQDDKALPFGDLVRWAIGHGIRFEAEPEVRRFPDLSAAVYTVCGIASGRCKSVTLAPGSTARIDLD